MLDSKLQAALNHQINLEFAASFTYLAMSAHFDQINLDGFATWMAHQSEEEQAHAHRLFRYVMDRGGTVELSAIEKPPSDFGTVSDVFERSLEQERENTRAINALYALARDVNDFATMSHLQWFLDEQVEEERQVEDIIGRLEIAAGDPSALLLLDDQIGRKARQDGATGTVGEQFATAPE